MWRQKNGLWSLARMLSGPLGGQVVLDAGCGDGWYTARLSEEAKEVHGVDVSSRAIEFAKSINSHASFISDSLVKLPYEDKKFDRIFSFQVIEHIPPDELPSVVKELSRVLTNNGLLIVTVPSVNRRMSRAHFQHFTQETLDAALNSRFSLVESAGQEKHTMLLHVIERVLHNRFWLLPELAEAFNRSYFLRFWNKTDAKEGQNIVAVYKKKL